MGKTTIELEHEITQTRNRLGRNLNALENRLRENLDWRRQFSRKPGVFVGAAFGFGLIFGLMTIRPRD